jgi:GNAT superfamily N-acetyltransferase
MAQVRELMEIDVAAIVAVDGGPAWNGGIEKWSRYWRQHASGERTCLVAEEQGAVAGYASVVWRSQHEPFARDDIPELQDLVVAERARRRGLGRALVIACESLAARGGHSDIGIGFGLYADYGAAQRLYVRLGYLPDGAGLTWNNRPARPGDMVRVDDDLVLWLRKRLGRSPPV